HVRPFDATYRPDHTFDLVVLLDVLEHIRDAEAAVSHAASLMEEGGTLLVTVPAFRSLWTTHDELNLHVTRYTREELVDQLSIGFEVDTVRYFFRWIHPVKLVQAAVEAVRRPEPRPPTVPWAPVNAVLYGLSRAEEVLLRRVPLAMGSSLIAVATKR
ncbi:MAG TPA: methyltransferase domain-containing protein, partial [Longimicrobiales bacterium]|nr:methyltransferase domain-containing protein [Longimicrobiales bacterium]